MSEYEHRIVIGDWSHDGHNQEEFFTFKCSHDEKTVQKAYLKAVKKSKVALHNNAKGAKSICCRYEESTINENQIAALKELGVKLPFAEGDGLCPIDVAIVFFEMVRTQIEDFAYELIPEKKPINGFWKDGFNYGFGYGCFQ